jgi:hypothetical protein
MFKEIDVSNVFNSGSGVDYMGKYVQPVAIGAVHPKQDKPTGDTNNCTVRTLANCTDMTYEAADALLKEAGREYRKGAYFEQFDKVYGSKAKSFCIVGDSKTARYMKNDYKRAYKKEPEIIEKGFTVGTFLEKHKTGVYAVFHDGHVFCVRNGQVYDTAPLNKNKRVCAYYVF